MKTWYSCSSYTLQKGVLLAVKIRLSRHGAKKRPFYRVVVADERMPRDGRYIEQVGTYNPLTHPHAINLDLERIDAWIKDGAQLSGTVSHLVSIVRDGDKPAPAKKQKKSKKQIERERAAQEAAMAEKEAAEQSAEQEQDASEEEVAQVEETVEA